MQYLLTKEEYNDLVPRSIYVAKLKEIEELQRLLMIAKGFTCRYDTPYNYAGFYCDNCPLAEFDCGKRKEFSKLKQ